MSIKSIAIVGGGPCGAAAAKAFVAERCFNKVKVFEKRSQFGGLWNYESETENFPVPNEVPYKITPIIKDDKIVWPSAAYDLLDTNVPTDVMTYASLPFPDTLPLFPHRSDVLKYMQNYAKDISPITQFNTVVVLVERENDQWKVLSRPVNLETAGGERSDQDTVEYFDAVVAAVGNYDVPFIPHRNGMEQWNQQFPGTISHVKAFKSPKQFENVKGDILVVGNSASAGDICYQLAEGLKRTIYKSRRSENLQPASPSNKIVDKPDIDRFDASQKRVYFIDQSYMDNVEKVIFATGYLKSYPFFEKLNKSKTPILTDGHKVHGTYQHVLLYNFPNLAVVGLPKFVLPTRVSESQACWLAKVWSGKVPLPSFEEMKKCEDDRIKIKGNGKNFHDMNFPEDVEYCNYLNHLVVSAKSNVGLKPLVWDERQVRIRASVKGIKEAYVLYRDKTGKLASTYSELEQVAPGVLVDNSVLAEKGFRY